jgi:large subunit ribosomal protein L6
MKKQLTEKIEVPEGIEFSVEDNLVTLKSGDKENSRRFNFYGVELKKEGKDIVIEAKHSRKKELQVVYTTKSHIKNMLAGLQEPFEYKLEIAFVHFPMTVELDKETNVLKIKNFLGEKRDRSAKILPGVEVDLGKNKITLKSHDIELAGQTAANIEKATHIRQKDRRKFQDGIYMTERPGGKI